MAAKRTWTSESAAALVRWRRRRGVTQAAVGAILGVSYVTVMCWERYGKAPSRRMQERLRLLLRGAPVPPPVREVVKIPGERILAWRAREGRSRRWLAEQVGANEATVHAWEHGIRHPRGEAGRRLQRLLAGEPLDQERDAAQPAWTLVDPVELRRWRTTFRVAFPALAAHLGCDPRAVRAWESGSRRHPRRLNARWAR